MSKIRVDTEFVFRGISFRKNCIFCKREIIMSNKEGEWHPYEIMGDPHKCPRRRKKAVVDQHQIKLDDIYLGQLIKHNIGNDIGNKLRRLVGQSI